MEDESPKIWIVNPMVTYIDKKPSNIYLSLKNKNDLDIKCVFDNKSKNKNKKYNIKKYINDIISSIN